MLKAVFASSVWSLLRGPDSVRSSWGRACSAPPPVAMVDPESLRAAMRALLTGLHTPAALRAARCIARSRDVPALWHLRATLMEALAAESGELNARRAVAALDPLFVQAWPEAPLSRPALLS